MQDIGSHPDHFIRLNLPARANIMQWYLFAEDWNGISMLWDMSRHQSIMDIHRLDQAVQEYYLVALTSSTHQAYA